MTLPVISPQSATATPIPTRLRRRWATPGSCANAMGWTPSRPGPARCGHGTLLRQRTLRHRALRYGRAAAAGDPDERGPDDRQQRQDEHLGVGEVTPETCARAAYEAGGVQGLVVLHYAGNPAPGDWTVRVRATAVNVGNPGSGQRATMEVVMEAMGWKMMA